MKYLMLVCHDETFTPPEILEPEAASWTKIMDERGVRKFGNRLRPAKEAKTIRIREGKEEVTNGPFAITKDAIAGFDILECSSMDEAIEVASKHPMAKLGTIEIRQFWEN